MKWIIGERQSRFSIYLIFLIASVIMVNSFALLASTGKGYIEKGDKQGVPIIQDTEPDTIDAGGIARNLKPRKININTADNIELMKLPVDLYDKSVND